MKKFLYTGLFLLIIAVLVVAMPVRLQEEAILVEVNRTFNYTKNQDCTDVVLSDSQTLFLNSFGVVETQINTNKMTGYPNWLCIYNATSLLRQDDVSTYDFNDELKQLPQVFSAWSNKSLMLPTPVNFNKVIRKDFFYNTTNGNDNVNITVRKAGHYLVSYNVGIATVTGNNTAVSECWLARNGASVPGTKSFAQHRNEANPEASHDMTLLVNLEKNDKLQVYCTKNSNTLQTIPEASRITMQFINKNKPMVE